ncbi:AraC family transcriptional regulator [Rhizobium sp. C4]|uniref:AraC family transcriptional regulator n=1 Tax=Rhizobium sp. C4 TaxID=1349800 RepID=UPI001E312C17|nr:AraC family transcriptional regulator [Rhizobium sp. C4]MCD2175601.1 helix-turn-helix domain-containing protein [Rhizobium sp. C4]
MPTEPERSGLTIHRDRFADIDRQAAQLSGYDQIYRQLSRGAFAGSFTTVEGRGGAGVYVETVNQVIEQFSSVPADQTSLVFLCGDQPSARFGARAFAPGTAMLLGPGAEIDFQSTPGTHVCVVTFGGEALRQAGEASGMLPPARGETRLIDNPAATGRLVQTVNALLHCALLAAGMGPEALDPDGFSAEIAAIMVAMSGFAGAGLAHRLPSPDRRAALFREARATIHDSLDTVSVPRLQSRLNVSRRTLEYAFHEAVGMSPHAYIAALRLDAVRRALKSNSDSIGDIAARYGIWHLGRLAGQFREAFGVLPSETRRGT